MKRMARWFYVAFLLALCVCVTSAYGAERVPHRVTIRLSAVGDCTLGRDERNGYDRSFDWYYDRNEPSYFFENVADIFAQDDLTIANFEGTLTEVKEAADKRFTFKGPAVYAQLLSAAHINAVNLANNHTMDYGSQGYADTLNALDEAGVAYFGNGKPYLYECNSILIALLGYSGFNSNCMDAMARDILALKEAGVSLVIVSFHWGEEREYYPTPLQQKLGRYAVDCGADLVVGHHPHVMQGIECYNGAYIVYSLGNFCFGGNRNPEDKDTFIYRQSFILEDGMVTRNAIELIPARVSSTTVRNDFKPTPLWGDAGKQVINRLIEYTKPFMDLNKPRFFRTYHRATVDGGY